MVQPNIFANHIFVMVEDIRIAQNEPDVIQYNMMLQRKVTPIMYLTNSQINPGLTEEQ